MTKRFRRLLDDAQKAGYEVDQFKGFWRVIKTVQVNQFASRRRGLRICDDGTAYREDVELSAAKGIRSYAEMREALGLSPEGS